jgi:hypothetical protein
MDYTSDPDGPPSNEHPNSHDFAQLQTIYSHTDSFNTTLTRQTPLSQLTNSPASWGRMVEGSPSSGGTATYLRTFGKTKVITLVIWA